ncbi:MAG: ABC transporter permease, partial [Anaerolineae bacterium]|nr:ABC transporter permease [Anaerolineae bacterium]
MTRAIEAEFFKLARRRATWLSIAGLSALPVLLGLIFRLVPVQGPDGASPATMSGYGLLLLTMSTAMTFFAPLVSSYIGAELLAKEIGDGTLKLSLVRPVSRAQVVLSKCLACLAHNAALVAALWLVGLIVGGVLFHYGAPDLSLTAGINVSRSGGEASTVGEVSMAGISGQAEALLRLGASFAYLALSLTVVGLLALFWSTLITNAAGVIVATLGAIIGMRALEGVEEVRQFLLSAHLVSGSLLAERVDWSAL